MFALRYKMYRGVTIKSFGWGNYAIIEYVGKQHTCIYNK